MYKRILLAYDGSAAGQQALLDCHEIAQWSYCELTSMAMMPFPMASLGPEGGVHHETVQESEKNRN